MWCLVKAWSVAESERKTASRNSAATEARADCCPVEDRTMSASIRPWPPSAVALLLAGITLIAAGLYFLFVRPSLLPEDVRYMGLSEVQIVAVRPRLEVWLTHVFRVMGGYVLATGALLATLAATSFRRHERVAALGALVAGAASIGWMTVVNFMINSDFKWTLLCMAILWAASLLLFWFETNRPASTEGSEKEHT